MQSLQKRLNKLTQKDFLYLFIFLLLFIFLRYNSFTSPFERDEGEYAYSAWLIRHGIMPYQNTFLQKPPLIIYIFILAQQISPTSLWAPRLLSSIFCFFSTFLTGYIAKNLFGKKYFWPAVFIFTPILAFPPHTPFAANTEVFMLAPLLAFFYLFTKNKFSPTIYFLAGVFAALAILFKPICLLIIIFVSLVWLLNAPFYFIFFFTLGGTLTTILIFIPFFLTNTFQDLFNQVVLFNIQYANSWNGGLSNLIFRLSKIISYQIIFVVLTIFYFFYPPKKPTSPAGRRPWLLPTIIFLGLYSIYKVTIGHYYILLSPFWALMVSYSLVKIAKNKVDIFVAIAVLISIIPFLAQFSKTPTQLSEWIYGNLNPFVDSQIVSEKIKNITSPNDKIFVAGSEPEILYYSQRQSSSKFVITYPLNINTKNRQEYQEQVISDLKKYPPKVIVYSQLQYSDLWEEGSPKLFIDYLNEQINKNYKLIGVTIRINNNLYWLENPEQNEIKNASLILYERKN